MILQDGRPLRQAAPQKILAYFWGGLASLSSILLLFALWQYAAQYLGSFVLPEPLPVIKKAVNILMSYRAHELPETLFRVFLGFLFSLTTGITLGLFAGYFKTLHIFLRPLITILLGTPPIIWIVLALFWFGMGDASVIFTVIITVTPLTFAAAARGMITVDKDLKDMFKAYHVSLMTQIKHLYIPQLLNFLLPALSIAIGTGIKITIMAELLGANDGMGAQIAMARAMLDTESVLAFVLVVLFIIMFVEYLILEPLKILMMPWEY